MAPEILERKGYSEKVDIYAYGIVIAEICTGQRPYSGTKTLNQETETNVSPGCREIL
jgi:serine/threonine protein kinase